MTKRKSHGRFGRVRPDGRNNLQAAYATIRCDLLASHAFRGLHGRSVRLMLLLEANASPNGPQPRMATFISHGHARKSLGGCPDLIVSSFRELERHGFIKLLKRGTRPGSMGGAFGSATEFWLPHRTNGTTDFEWKTSGAPRVAGYWRVHNEKLRRLAKDLSDIEAKVLCDLMARDRDDDGHFRAAEIKLPLRALARRLNMSVGAASKAVSALVTKQVITRIGGGTGRSPARFHVDRDYAQPVSRRRRRSRDHGGRQG